MEGLFVQCEHPKCRKWFPVKDRCEQRRRKRCSHACGGPIAGRKPRLPRYLECQECGRIVDVQHPSTQRKRKFCSLSCAGKAQRGKQHLKATAASVAKRKRAYLAQIEGLTPLEAFKRGYRSGLLGKLAHIRRKYFLVPREKQVDNKRRVA